MPALLAEALIVDDATATYERSVALEDLWTPSTVGALLIPALEKRMAPELAAFLATRHEGALAVTRSMIDRMLRVRFGQFGAVRAAGPDVHRDGDHGVLGPVFTAFPDDTGHWGVNYFEHLLSPLRHAPPGYVLEIMSDDFVEDSLVTGLPDNVAGIVVVRLP